MLLESGESVVLEEDISEEVEHEAVETTEEEEVGEITIDQLKFFANISRLWHDVIHGNLPIEVLLSMRESTKGAKTPATSKKTRKKEKSKKTRKKKKEKKEKRS